jgi:hypothetical protein
VRDPTDPCRTRSQFEGATHVLTSIEPLYPMHAYMVLASDPHSYAEAEGNTYWDISMDVEYNSLIQNNMWDLIMLPPD